MHLSYFTACFEFNVQLHLIYQLYVNIDLLLHLAKFYQLYLLIDFHYELF